MTKTEEKNHYFVSFEDSTLFRAFLAANGLKSDQISVIRHPLSGEVIPRGETVFVLGKPSNDTQVELDIARISRSCVIRPIFPFDKIENEALFHG